MTFSSDDLRLAIQTRAKEYSSGAVFENQPITLPENRSLKAVDNLSKLRGRTHGY